MHTTGTTHACCAGYTYAAGLNAMRGATAMLKAPPGSSFEVFGVDMLVDTDYRPWLVEVNAVPSLARKVCHDILRTHTPKLILLPTSCGCCLCSNSAIICCDDK